MSRFNHALCLIAGVLLLAAACGKESLGEVSNLPPTAVIAGGDRQAVQATEAFFDGSDSTDADGSILSYSWDYGDGNVVSDTGFLVAHVYNAIGTYTVTLTVTDDRGATGSTSVSVEVIEPGANLPPIVIVSAPGNVILAGVSMTLTATASDPDGIVVGRNWSFGDGTPEQAGVAHGDGTYDVAHAFPNATTSSRTYTVIFEVTDDLGATATDSIDIEVLPTSNQAPTVTVSAPATVISAGVSLTFTAVASDADGSISSYLWSFGDGTADSPGTDNGSGNYEVTHAFANTTGSPRTFTVTFTVTDNEAAQGNDSVDIEVIAGTNEPPVVDITAPTDIIASGAPLPFTGTATDPDGSIATWTWNFGDGTAEEPGSVAGSDNTVSHVFTNTGTASVIRDVTLTVVDDQGASAQDLYTIEVEPQGATSSYDGMWFWALNNGEPVDPSGAGLCAFYDSQLEIITNGGSMTINEIANSTVQATYAGTFSDPDFSVSNGMLVIQTISGTFDSATSFSGFYTVNTGGIFPSCDTSRGVTGTKQ